MVASFFSDNITTIFITLICLFIIPSLLINLIIHMICIKFKIKIKFNVKRFHQLANIEILKLKDNKETDKLLEIFIDNIWVSSCYLNRQVNSRILLSFKSIRIQYSVDHGDNEAQSLENNPSGYFFNHWLVLFYLKYIGSMNIDSLSIKMLNISKGFETSLIVNTLKMEFNHNKHVVETNSNSKLT